MTTALVIALVVIICLPFALMLGLMWYLFTRMLYMQFAVLLTGLAGGKESKNARISNRRK